jgi:hypothetical protein
MLKILRKNTKIVIWSVIISFVLWGGYSVGTQFRKEGRIAGEVFGKNVSFQEFDAFYRAGQIFSVSGKPLEDPELLKQHAWQSIIFSREAKRQKINVSDDEVLAEVFRLLSAQGIEKPAPEIYRRWLQATVRETPQEFENQVREIMRIQKLLRQVNAGAVKPPSEETIHRQFLRENQVLTAGLMLFPSLDKAKAFRQEVLTAQKWNEKIKSYPQELRTLTKVNVDSLIKQWQVPEKDAFALHGMATKTVSEPVPVGTQYGIFHLIEKENADEKKYQSEFKEKYTNEVTSNMKYQHFVFWATDLREKARLKDYMPRAEQPASSGPSTTASPKSSPPVSPNALPTKSPKPLPTASPKLSPKGTP